MNWMELLNMSAFAEKELNKVFRRLSEDLSVSEERFELVNIKRDGEAILVIKLDGKEIDRMDFRESFSKFDKKTNGYAHESREG